MAQGTAPGRESLSIRVPAGPPLMGRTDVVAERVRGHPRRQTARLRPLLGALHRPARPANTARFVFLDPRAAGFFVDWDRVASEVVATLRSQAGRDPYGRGLSDLVGELSTRSEEFGTRWAAHNVRRHRTGRKQLHHPVVGDLRLTYEVMDLWADPRAVAGA